MGRLLCWLGIHQWDEWLEWEEGMDYRLCKQCQMAQFSVDLR